MHEYIALVRVCKYVIISFRFYYSGLWNFNKHSYNTVICEDKRLFYMQNGCYSKTVTPVNPQAALVHLLQNKNALK